MLTRNHTVLHVTHKFVHKANEPSFFPSCRASPHVGR